MHVIAVCGSPRKNGNTEQALGRVLDKVKHTGIGAELVTLAQLSFFFGIMGMVQIGSSYWNIGFGGATGDILSDAEGVATFERYGENLVWALQKLRDKS
jgi:multimeric flavodoxin WrbA